MTVMSLEKRVTILETLLGIASNETQLNLAGSRPFSSSFPLVEAISKLEQRMSMLDSSNLDALRVKANTLRGELESAAKLKSPLTVENRALEAAKKVEDLVEKVTKIEAVAEDLRSARAALQQVRNGNYALSPSRRLASCCSVVAVPCHSAVRSCSGCARATYALDMPLNLPITCRCSRTRYKLIGRSGKQNT